MQNKYPTLSHRFSKLRMISAVQKQPYPPGDSYQIRELLWHQFSVSRLSLLRYPVSFLRCLNNILILGEHILFCLQDFLMILVPLINLHIVKRYWATVTNYWSPQKSTLGVISSGTNQAKQDVVAKCCYCGQDAVIPQFVNKCSFCYYCLKANQIADAQFVSTNCPHS